MWSEEMEDTLCLLWQERACLYDTTTKSYSNRNAVQSAKREVSQALGVNEKELMAKMTTLRTQFSRYSKTITSGSGAPTSTPRKQWVLKNLSFLAPFIKKRVSVSNIDQDQEEQEEDRANTQEHIADEPTTSLNDSQTEEPEGKEREDENQSIQEAPKPQETRASNNKRKRNGNGRDAEEMSMLRKMVNVIQEDDTKDDAISIFCAHIDRQMRQIHDPVALLMLQNKIEQDCFQARLEYLQQQAPPPQPQIPQAPPPQPNIPQQAPPPQPQLQQQAPPPQYQISQQAPPPQYQISQQAPYFQPQLQQQAPPPQPQLAPSPQPQLQQHAWSIQPQLQQQSSPVQPQLEIQTPHPQPQFSSWPEEPSTYTQL